MYTNPLVFWRDLQIVYTGFTDGVTGFTETATGFTDPDKLSYDRSGPPQTSGNDVLSLDIDTAGL